MQWLAIFVLTFVGYCLGECSNRGSTYRPVNCTRPNEESCCGSACQNECATLGEQGCPIQNVTCNNKCYCKKGYARDCNCKCIPVTQCPRRKLCERSCTFMPDN